MQFGTNDFRKDILFFLVKNCLALFAALFLAAPGLPAQSFDSAWLEGVKPRSIGPAGMSGRVTAIAVDPNDDDKIWVGTASGGLWLTDNGGTSWRPVFDDQPVQSIGAIALNPHNPAELWVGTGEGNPRNSHNSGRGLYHSIDGGRTWRCAGLENTRLIHRIIVHRDDPNTIWVGAMGSAWGPSADRGLYRSRDRGKNWEKVLYVNDRTGVADMVVDPRHPDKLIVAMWEFARTPWNFRSGGEGSGLYMSYDGGDSFTRLSDKEGLPEGTLGRIGLAIARSKPSVVYALVEAEKKNALYRSDNGGHNWKVVATENIGNRPFYYADIFVDPKNENRLYNLYSMVTRSEDGGKTFEVLLPYHGVHPDHHAFWISPDNPEYIIDGNDGGLNISRDGGENWQFINNLPLGQFYHVNYDMDEPYNIYGGMQDNGSWVGPAYVLKSGGIRNYDWQELYFGDGFDVVPHRGDSRYGYAMSQGGNLAFYDRQTGATRFIKPVHPGGEKLRFNWNAAIAADPFSDDGVYYGSQYLHFSRDRGSHWSILSPDLTSNDPEKQRQHESGGLTIDATSAENHTTILCIAPSPADSNVIWVGTDDGRVQLTRNRGANWQELSGRLPDFPEGAWVPQVLAGPSPGEALVVVNDYRRDNWEAYLYRTADFGKSWSRLIDAGDMPGPVHSAVADAEAPGLIWAGTEFGLWYSIDGGAQWQKWTAGLPSVPVFDLKIHPREADLIIGTFGRAIYVLDDIRFMRALSMTPGGIPDSALRLFEIPAATDYHRASYSGIRFTADAEYIGDNRRSGARFTVWVAPDSLRDGGAQASKREVSGKKARVKAAAAEKAGKSGKKKGSDKLFFVVKNMDGDTIRRFSQKRRAGIRRYSWHFEEDGVRGPSQSRPGKGDELPGGVTALPGDYLLVVSCGDHRDSARFTLRADPRMADEMVDLAAKRAAQKDFEAVTDKAAQAHDRLLQVEEAIDFVKKHRAHWPDSLSSRADSTLKPVVAQLDSLKALFFLKTEKDGYHDSSHTLSSKLWQVRRYLSSGWAGPGGNAAQIKRQVSEEVDAAVRAVNDFVSGPWAEWSAWLEALPVSRLAPVKPVDAKE